MMSMPHKARDYGMTAIVNERVHCNNRLPNGPKGMVYKLAACVNDHFARLFDSHAFLCCQKRAIVVICHAIMCRRLRGSDFHV